MTEPVIPGSWFVSGSSLRAARKAAKLSCEEVARKLTAWGDPHSADAIRCWERGRSEPRASTMNRLCLLYKTHQGFFFRPRVFTPAVSNGGRR